MYTIKFLLEAEIELADACKWYEKRKNGLGKEFLDEFDRCAERISNNPYQYPINFAEKYRFALLKKFPYSVVYRIEDDKLFIISIFHQKRNPLKFL